MPPLIAMVLLLLIGSALRCTRVTPYQVPDGETVFSVAEGLWDWAGQPGSCTDNPHTISFTEDRSEMLLTYTRPDSTTSQREYRYEIRDVGPSSIRGFIHGETRRTDDGQLVVWDLVLTGHDEYRWHRTDWPPRLYTGKVVRCDVPGAPPPSPRGRPQ